MIRQSVLAALAVLALGLAAAPKAETPAGLGPVTGKVVWVDFWASWCGPCRRSFPWMNQMLDRYGEQGLQIIGVNVDKERKLADAFLVETPAAFELRFDPAGALALEFGVEAMPSSFLLDGDGKLIASHYGFRYEDAPEYEAAIVNALSAAGSRSVQ